MRPFKKVERNSVYPRTSQILSVTLSGYYHDAIKKKGYKHCLYKTVIEQVEQNSMYSKIPQIPSIALGGYYHDVIKQQVNKYDELRKGISNN